MSKKTIARTRKPTKRAPKRAKNTQNRETAERLRDISATMLRQLAPLVRGLQADTPVGPLRSMLIALCQLEDVAHYLAPELPRAKAVQS
ncbi:MAG: hypothetical protein IPM35_02575 [Myxococcales bacterium]|nr:hypothetical protein [Myxococcales bacterium]